MRGCVLLRTGHTLHCHSHAHLSGNGWRDITSLQNVRGAKLRPGITRVHDEFGAHEALDWTGRALQREYEVGRALRLFLEMGFVNKWPVFARSSRWSETGDCYVLKLFWLR
mmetsp:Transcript_14858/g.18688  ORF Transcript_14858/g.18688 Transcript_14858/m.18688 type:complete len:111 (-) Transcript_14858:2-334(-)